MTTSTPTLTYQKPVFQRGWKRQNRFLIMTAMIAVGVLIFFGQRAMQTAVPDGLTAVGWNSIQNQIAAAEYQFVPVANNYAAPNRAQGWQTTFSPQRVQVNAINGDWNWGLTLTSYGYAGTLQSFQDLEGLVMQADKETLTTQWDANLSEWWVNSAAGLEQGFTLQERPIGAFRDTPLQIEMAVTGSLTPVLNGSDVLFQDAAGETILRYDRLHVIDANGKTIPAFLQLDSLNLSKGTNLQIVVDDAAAVYPLTIDPWLQQAKLTASDAAAGDNFGYSVAVDGDTAIVGAYHDADGGLDSGSAYVFVRSGTTWTQQQKLTAADAAPSDWFGNSVAISGDTVIVGAYKANAAYTDSGAAYVFVRSGTTWTQQKKLTASDAAATDYFGISVAVSGGTAVVGAYLDDDIAVDSGSAYVFERNFSGADNWGQQKKLTADDPDADDRFGFSVAVSGDTAVVGAYKDDDGGANSGSAYVFERSGTTWTQQKKLATSTTGDYFGYSVAISVNTAVVGAYLDDDVAINNSGSAYVFERDLGGVDNWGQQQKLTANDAAETDNFGRSVAVSGDTAVVGAYLDDDVAANSGSAYVFERNLGGVDNWGQQQKLTATDAAESDFFGNAVAVSGDTAVVGAYQDDDVAANSGSAYVFTPCIASASSGSWSDTVTWVGGVAPTGIDDVCVQNGHTVTLAAAAAANSLHIFAGGVLDLSAFDITVENGISNYGTMQQTQDVGASSTVNFMQIRDSGNTADQYRGVDITTDASTNLGTTLVQIIGNSTQCNTTATDGGAYRSRCFMVNSANAGSVLLTLYSTPGEDKLSDDAFFQWASGTTWTQGAACTDGVGVGGACTGIGTFASPAWFLIGSAGNAPTAVSLQSISANSKTAVLPVLITTLLLLFVGGVALQRRSRTD